MNDAVTVPVTSPHMLAEIEGAIGWMTFNKPERRNAVSLDMWEAIPEILRRFEDDPAVRVIVLKGAGDKAFVSGADISQFEKAMLVLKLRGARDRKRATGVKVEGRKSWSEINPELVATAKRLRCAVVVRREGNVRSVRLLPNSRSWVTSTDVARHSPHLR